MISRSKHRTGKPKVKSGCRTCKIRKVKCDEGRPVCRRCCLTGRVCDGYGVWGHGDGVDRRQQAVAASAERLVLARPIASVAVLASGTVEEKRSFEWFTCRSATKLPGSFVSSFWTTLLFQASLTEPAVLHAVLALSSVHQGGIIVAGSPSKPDDASVPREQQQFALQHYVKAISHLQPHFFTKDKASFRVALITCLVFIWVDFLRGHVNEAQIHLQNGLKILRELQLLSPGSDGSLCWNPGRESTDDWIVEAFFRLYLQVELFHYTYHHSSLVLHAPWPETPAVVFHSIHGAWRQMDQLLSKIFHLALQGRQYTKAVSHSTCYPRTLIRQQQRIRTGLAQWLDMFKVFKRPFRDPKSAEKKVCRLMYPYHTMASIMLDTCLQSTDELVFDSCTHLFVRLINQLAELADYATDTTSIHSQPGHRADMSRSIVDIGWITPLYFAAVKCRIHRIRLQAIRLLETSAHREGIWDTKTAACVAKKVMEVEERDFYKDIDTADDFSLPSAPRAYDLSLPVLPEPYRIREVEVVLSGSPMDKILLFGKEKREGKDFRVLISTYDLYSQCWTD
ncbi:hypothetical protein BP6252_04985 [Coleophoma cylindrospora]|uniref:Zn(2)-C6 fungal-type domain-containing protein n=1 Tax=Coleophoma cylindrospora TaxID=1849047 RepID=A0A3D8RS69_9HELO|nr:hypothetical protein BP6252_04985 [Coleophoma cylindrospora]